jgi:hypothetical protein
MRISLLRRVRGLALALLLSASGSVHAALVDAIEYYDASQRRRCRRTSLHAARWNTCSTRRVADDAEKFRSQVACRSVDSRRAYLREFPA